MGQKQGDHWREGGTPLARAGAGGERWGDVASVLGEVRRLGYGVRARGMELGPDTSDVSSGDRTGNAGREEALGTNINPAPWDLLG